MEYSEWYCAVNASQSQHAELGMRPKKNGKFLAALHFNDSLMLVGPAPGKALPCQGEVLVAGRQENARMVTSSMLRM